MEKIFIIILTLSVVIIIPWMMRRDFQKRMLKDLRSEILSNMERIKEYVRGLPENDTDKDLGVELCTPVLTDTVFKKMLREHFHSRVLSNDDKDMLEKVLTNNFRHTGNIKRRDCMNICLEQIHILEGIQEKIDGFLKE
ncbi:MAG TPA: hypothetical protein ENN05_06155 [Deltaproteobacteria bacterium]|nr:hypothetical protein [Deltaproteobacteria bacterium]